MTDPETCDPQAVYRIEVARAVRFDGLLLRGDITMTGEAVARLIAREGADIVISATRIDGDC